MQLFVNDLTNVDFSYLHPTRGVVGETWLASVNLFAELNDIGMVCDFGIVKKCFRDWLDDEVDHRLVVPLQAPGLEVAMLSPNDRQGTSTEAALNAEPHQLIKLVWPTPAGDIICTAPRQAFVFMDIETVTESRMAAWIVTQVQKLLPDEMDKIDLSFRPETIDGAFYHYSHGLKRHDGNCQRIAHGHRSRLHVWRNGERDTAIEAQWAERWQDIYLGSDEDVVLDRCTETHMAFAYDAQQGHFTLDIPKSVTYMMPTDTTVEWIATHLAEQIKAEYPKDSVRVQAFEGINKGAMVDR